MTNYYSNIMKNLKQITKNILLITLLLFFTIPCNSQKRKKQEVDKYPDDNNKKTNTLLEKDIKQNSMDDSAVYRDFHGTKEQELQGQLQIALGNNDVSELTQLLQNGANANKLPNTDLTPLMLADSLEIAQLLLDNGANPLAIDANGRNLLHYAVSKKSALKLIPLYASLNVDVNAQDNEKYSPIFLAIDYFNETYNFDNEPIFVGKEIKKEKTEPQPKEVLKALVANGANLNAFDEYGSTPLMACTANDNSELVKILLDLGADRNILNQYGQTAKDIAYKTGRRHIYQLLE